MILTSPPDRIIFSTTAVLLRATRNNIKTDLPACRPSNLMKTQVRRALRNTFRLPPNNTVRTPFISDLKENSIPIVNSSNTTPISSSILISCISSTLPRPCGPMRIPVIRNPSNVGIYILWKSRITRVDKDKNDQDIFRQAKFHTNNTHFFTG